MDGRGRGTKDEWRWREVMTCCVWFPLFCLAVDGVCDARLASCVTCSSTDLAFEHNWRVATASFMKHISLSALGREHWPASQIAARIDVKHLVSLHLYMSLTRSQAQYLLEKS